MTVATDRDGERGEFAVADDPAELAFGSEHAAAVQRSAISSRLRALTLREVRRTHSIIDSHGFVDYEPGDRSILSHARVRISGSRCPRQCVIPPDSGHGRESMSRAIVDTPSRGGARWELARYLVDAVVLEKRSCREVARAHGVSKSWVAKLVARYRAGGYEAIAPRSKAATKVANRSSVDLEDRVVRLRKELAEDGFDAGAQTIHYHLSLSDPSPPSTSTIWRILKRRGFVAPQPHKRPKSSYIRFEASLPNETWQSDVTVFELKDGTKIEILNFLDDFSRVCVASKVLGVTSAPDVVATLYEAGGAWGLPASVLTDNGCIYTAAYRHGYSAMESELFHLGIDYKHSRPYHPQTCGKVERFHQTLKKFLRKQPRAETIAQLQRQVDRFVAYYG